MAQVLGKCPRCGGHTTTGDGGAAEVETGIDGEVLWEGDVGEEACIGSWDGHWEDYYDLPESERDGCGWWQVVGDVDGQEAARGRYRAQVRAEMM